MEDGPGTNNSDGVGAAFDRAYARSVEDPAGFWLEAARAIDWHVAPTAARDPADDAHPAWFYDGVLNTSVNALDRHVAAGHGERLAVIYDSPVTATVERFTYSALLDEVQRTAGALAGLGVVRGDRVVIYMPMVLQAVVAMLACARLGAVHSVVFGGFAPKELAARIDDACPRAVLAATCGIEPSGVVRYIPHLKDALRLAEHEPEHVVVLQRPQSDDELAGAHDWDDLVRDAVPAGPVFVAAGDPLYILYTSGTSGKPKGVVRDNGGHAVAMTWSMEHIYGVAPGDVYWAASDIGWVVGHSYIVYAPLIHGATTVLYEGKPVGTPDAGAFGRVIADHGVNVLFTAPTAIRAVAKVDPEAALIRSHDLTTLRRLFLAGERLDPATYDWARARFEVPVIDNWWQTETGWPIAANLAGAGLAPAQPRASGIPMPGYDVRVLNERGDEVRPEDEGAVCIRLPLPPGTLQGVWGDEDRYRRSYLESFPGFYETGDGGYMTADGHLFVLGRTDDVINVAGHRLSSGVLEAALASHPDVAEAAVVGVPDDVKGEVPRGFVVLREGAATPDGLEAEMVSLVREQVGAVAALKLVDVVSGLPKTRSGKVLRRSLRRLSEGHVDDPIPPTIEDPRVLEVLREQIRPR